MRCTFKESYAHWYSLVFLSAILSIIYVSTFSMPFYCIFKKISGIPCPGCGLTRACLHLVDLRFTEAVKQNILVVPLALLALAGSVCFLIDRFFDKNWLSCLHSALTSTIAVRLSIVLTLFSWFYNLTVGN